MPAGSLDLADYESELARARAARAAGRLEDAAGALRAALRLWRGPLCDGLNSPFLDAQRDRLAESRISVVEERIELELAIGGGTDPVAELRDLIAEHPLRERLRGLLMRALYQAGRQGDALAAYAEARRRLHDELGVEPAAPLQRLHQQILAADPQLAAAPAAEVSRDPDAGPARGGRSRPSYRTGYRTSPAATPSSAGWTPCWRPTAAAPGRAWSSRPSPAPPGSARPPWRCTGRTRSASGSRTGSCT